MNVFQLTRGAALTSLNAQILRLAPAGTKVCVLELLGDPSDEQLAREVATLLAKQRSSELMERKVQGYQIGSLPEYRTKSYILYFMG